MQFALERLPSGARAGWADPARGLRGSFMPVATWRDASGHFCRRFRARVRSATGVTETSGTACRRRGGYWMVITG